MAGLVPAISMTLGLIFISSLFTLSGKVDKQEQISSYFYSSSLDKVAVLA